MPALRFLGYEELVDVLGELPASIRFQRRRKGLSLREAARQSGVGLNTLSRWERGMVPDESIVKILKWLAS